MPSSELYEDLRRIVQEEFADVVSLAEISQLTSGVPRKLRLNIIISSEPQQAIREFSRFIRTLLRG